MLPGVHLIGHVQFLDRGLDYCREDFRRDVLQVYEEIRSNVETSMERIE
jgi:hypothetical protein